MKPLAFLTLISLLFCAKTQAQYADLGTGAQRNSIWWFNWAGFTVAEGASKTFVTNDGLTVTVTFSNVSAHVPLPNVMNTYPGALLYLMYDFSDPTIKPALFDFNSTTNFSYTLTMTATRNGLAVPFTFVAADAEASFLGELTTLQTNGSPWQTIEFYRNDAQTDDPLSGCGTQTVVNMNTYGGNMFTPTQFGQIPIVSTQSPGTSPLVVPTNFDHGGTFGGMALAFGIFESVDRGDLPASYGTAQHMLLYNNTNPCNFNPPYPAMVQFQTLHLGNVPGDADPIQYADDNAIGVDEEGVSTFPAYNNAGSYSVNLTLNNTTGSTAWLTGWFDFNRDGTFGPGESVTIPVPNNTTAATMTWTGLPTYLPQGTATGYGFRFRISSDQQATQNATGYAPDGEVEDYLVPPATLCSPITLTVTPDQSICTGQNTNLQVSGAVTYTWSPPDGLSDPSSANPIAAPLTTTLYNIAAATPQGCTASTSVTVTVKPSPVITVTGQSTICQGTSTSLTATGGINYSWSTPNQGVIGLNPSITVNPGSNAQYFVTGTAVNGCSAADTVAVTVQPPPTLSASPTQPSVCIGDSAVLSASGGDQYAWSASGGQPLGTDSFIVIHPTADGDYQVQITNSFCQLSRTFLIPVTLKATPDLHLTSSNDISCTVGQTTLQATGALSYTWLSSPGLSDIHSADPVVTPRQTTTFYVVGTGANGCSATDSITVKVDFNTELSTYPVPNAFTPNTDGRNDCFGLKGWGQLTHLEFSVYDRWGVRVFYTTDQQGCWDGTFKGTPQPEGGYVYEIKATTPCGTAYRKGVVMLLR